MLHSNWGDTPVHTNNYKAIANRIVSVDEWNVGGNPDRRDQRGAANGIDASDPRARVWLFDSGRWNKSFPSGWEAMQVLGSGGFGIVGHWRYVAAGPHRRGPVEGHVRDIVVKQASALHNSGLVREAHAMEVVTRTGSRHFPRIYGRLHRDVGRQENAGVDQKRREVHRLFMEFCEGGSLGGHIKKVNQAQQITPEADIWAWFHCFAKAMVLLERGHEMDADSLFMHNEPWGKGLELVHFDIKPDNALIANHDSGEHASSRRVVVSDFGLAQYVPNERNGPHANHDEILDRFEQLGTVVYRAPEQQPQKIPRPRRRYGACTNIYQIGCILYCLIIQADFFHPHYDKPTFTPLTGVNNQHRTMGGAELELMTHYSHTLRGLAAECLFLDPAYRPTAMQLLHRTRAGLNRVDAFAAQASKANERLNPIRDLLLEPWFGRNPSQLWPNRIPEMQGVVDLRKRQLRQSETAMGYRPGRQRLRDQLLAEGRVREQIEKDRVEKEKRAARNAAAAAAAAAAGPAGGQKPPAAMNPPAAGPAVGQKPPAGGNQPAVPPRAGHNGAGRAPRPVANTDPIPVAKKLQNAKFKKFADDLIKGKHPRKPVAPPRDAAFEKEPDWNKVTKRVNPTPNGRVPQPPQKRPSDEPLRAPDPKKSRLSPPAPINLVDRRLGAGHPNRANPPPPPPPPPAPKTFIMPVRIWPGPMPNPADEAMARLCSFEVTANITLVDLVSVMARVENSDVKNAVHCRFAKPGSVSELLPTLTLAELGYGPGRGRRAHLECFRTMFVPGQYGPGGVVRTFTVIVFLPKIDTDVERPRFTIRAGYQMSILDIKKMVIKSDDRKTFKVPTQIRVQCRGNDTQAWDCPDQRFVKSFFRGDPDVVGKLWCSLREIGVGGSGSNRKALPFNPVYTPPPPPPRHRTNKRFL
ncbi:hypothetical protein VE03_00734 [Pseudogymnoascus sp. 23342-1-I1]|nr:hypothetical protein VE03_00734 [Pseudogymnoascus sp. 23342-1-I1]